MTFRTAENGLWARYDPAELVAPGAFERDPRLVWGYYSLRRKLIEEVTPNPAHEALVELEYQALLFSLVAQNVRCFSALRGAAGQP
ncbi:MAG: hypothetical protein M3305_05115 [Actinomycetota bacterium]|nr:hypothetical protein [Actinomycetota bacterium]